jgi:predicted metal-dependent enzyme (double-stranded beta helix superfamily)
MNQPLHELSLDEFIVEMSRQPATSLEHERLMDLARRLRLSDELIELRSVFAGEQYARNLVCRTPYFELLVLCWRPGHASTIHDHAGSLNAIRVHAGRLTSRLFVPVRGQPMGTGPVAMTAEEHVGPGDDLVGVDTDGIHQLANTSDEDLITIHVYAPPLTELTVYDTESGVVERRTLRYTLAADLD